MAKDLNKVMLIGRLGTEPELRYTQQGAPITTFRLAIGRQWRDSDGQQRDETDWFTVVAWNRLAEICGEHLSKGARVYIEGRMQNRSWDDAQTGEKRYRTEVIASDMIMLDGRGERLDSGEQPYADGRSSRMPRRRLDLHDDFGDDDIPL
jgi:single-strand DNA-binding protein